MLMPSRLRSRTAPGAGASASPAAPEHMHVPSRLRSSTALGAGGGSGTPFVPLSEAKAGGATASKRVREGAWEAGAGKGDMGTQARASKAIKLKAGPGRKKQVEDDKVRRLELRPASHSERSTDLNIIIILNNHIDLLTNVIK